MKKINKNLILFNEEKLYQFYKLSKFLFSKDCNSFLNRRISPNKTHSTVSIQGDLHGDPKGEAVNLPIANLEAKKEGNSFADRDPNREAYLEAMIKSDPRAEAEKENLNKSLFNNKIKENKLNRDNENKYDYDYLNYSINSNKNNNKNLEKNNHKLMPNIIFINKDNITESQHSKDKKLRDLLNKKQPPNLKDSIKEYNDGINTNNNKNFLDKSPNELILSNNNNIQIIRNKTLSENNNSSK